MILQAYSFYDSKGGLFSLPFFTHTDGLAIRMTLEVVNDRSTSISKYPSDFTLMRVGSWDDQLGSFTVAHPVSLGVVQSFLVSQESSNG